MSGPFDYLAILLRQASPEERNTFWAPMSTRERDVVRLAYERLYKEDLPLIVSAPVMRDVEYIPSPVAFGGFPRRA